MRDSFNIRNIWSTNVRSVQILYLFIMCVLCSASEVMASDESFAESCQVIVQNPKAKKASQAQCECVLQVFREVTQDDVFAARVAYFKESDHQTRFKMMWDASIKLGPHKFQAQISEASDRSVVTCGTNMDSFVTKQQRRELAANYDKDNDSGEPVTASETGTATPTSPPSPAAVDKKAADQQTSNEQETVQQTGVVTSYDWPKWWTQ